MSERNAHSKSLLDFGKASMYVIAENGLQKETAHHQIEQTGEKNSLSAKNIISSRTKAITFSWKEIHPNASERNNNVRVLDLNDSLRGVNGNKKSYINTLRTKGFAGTDWQKCRSTHPHCYLKALGVNDLKQTSNDHKRKPCLRPVELDEGSKSGICGCKEDRWAEKKLTRAETGDNQEDCIMECLYEMKPLPRSSSDSMPSEPGNEDSAKGPVVEQADGESEENNLPSVLTLNRKKDEKPTGKRYLRRIFYAKGNDLWNPGNQEHLPQIQKKTKNQTGTALATMDNSSAGKMDQNSPNSANCLHINNQFLLPLNTCFLKSRGKQKHHLNSTIKLPTVVDKNTGQIHLALGAIAYEPSDYNKWSRKQKRIPPGSTKIQSSFPYPFVLK